MSDFEDFTQQPHARAQGRAGEDAAEAWLTRRGYQILHRNAVTEAGEIDLVATDGDTLCFVEIKARSATGFGPAVESVTPRKQRRLARCAALWLAAHPWTGPCRFDVLGLDPGPDGWEFTLLQDAFWLA